MSYLSNQNTSKKITLRFTTTGNMYELGIDEGDLVFDVKKYIWSNKLDGLTAGYGRIQLSRSGTTLHQGYDLYNMRNAVINVMFKELTIGPNEDLRGENLSGAELSGADLSGADLSDANLSGANLSGADLTSAILIGAKLQGVKLQDAKLAKADFKRVDLSGVDLRCIYLQGVDLRHSNLSGTKLNGDLSDLNLSGTDLSGADLEGANLFGANLEGSNLSHANLKYANLEGANLFSANLFMANLFMTNLSGALLDTACFSGAKLFKTDLSDISCPTLLKAVMDDDHTTVLQIFKKIGNNAVVLELKKIALNEALLFNKSGPIIDVLVDNRKVIGTTLRHFDLDSVRRERIKALNDSIYLPELSKNDPENCETAFDMVEQDYTDIIEYLRADDVEDSGEKLKRVVLFIGETPSQLKPVTMSLNQLLYGIHNTLYTSDCLKNRHGQYVDGAEYSRLKDTIFKFQFTGSYSVYLRNLIDILNSDKRVFYILPLMGPGVQRIEVERSASLGNIEIDNPLGDMPIPDYASAHHCQPGTEQKMYGIYVCEGRGDNPLYPVCSGSEQ